MEITKFNETIDIWIDELSRFNIWQLKIKPDERSWSLGQLYNHLIEETNWYNDQIEVTLGNEENICKTTSNAAKILFKRGSFENKRFQGDPFISENVKQPITVSKLKSELEQLKKKTNDIWIIIMNTSKLGKSEHPGLGFLNCYEWIQYSEMHMRHHLKQKIRIEEFLKQSNNYSQQGL
ncbi:hypothetical protein [Algoriphagus halophilus]|uniref:DinB superfamily protein n=1 Tax=Algoriphagus halophilus TaxID=226505 RepID=A0A1N6H125_9BACT|nr:hypothetical protein [Algoriphagus halophilus]SIO13503.1 hypothetical protein SAMN05444394_3461 [Algoriphagus halophilus]